MQEIACVLSTSTLWQLNFVVCVTGPYGLPLRLTLLAVFVHWLSVVKQPTSNLVGVPPWHLSLETFSFSHNFFHLFPPTYRIIIFFHILSLFLSHRELLIFLQNSAGSTSLHCLDVALLHIPSWLKSLGLLVFFLVPQRIVFLFSLPQVIPTVT